MKDLFETLIGFEAQHTRRSARRKDRGSYEGEALRDLMGGSTSSEMNLDLEQAITGSRSSILEDFDYDRDFEEATQEPMGDTGEELNFEE